MAYYSRLRKRIEDFVNDNNTMPTRIFALLFGLVVNALGNGLTVSTNMGAAPWTAAEVNLAALFHLSVGLMMFIVGVLVAVANQLLIRQWDKWRFFGEVAFIAGFSYFIDVFIAFFDWVGVPQLPVLARVALCFLGVVIFCAAISFYQRANLIMHPNDDTTNILRFIYFKGRVVVAQLVNFLVPVVMIAITVALSHRLLSVNIGTIFCILFNGPLIGVADRHLWHHLHHNFRVKVAK